MKKYTTHWRIDKVILSVLFSNVCVVNARAISIMVLLWTFSMTSLAVEKAGITIQPQELIGPVNRMVLGNNIIGVKKGHQKLYFDRTGGGIWNPVTRNFNSEYIKLFKSAGISVLRWPGGPWPQSMDWRKLVGPVAQRPDHTFGLPEFLALCKEIGAKPLITLSASRHQQAQIPGLIEYLKGANDGANPNGGVDWARVRASDGHELPWDVEWFEFGNETFRTNLSPDDYVKDFLAVYEKMRAIAGKNFVLGAVLEDSDNMVDGWNKIILSNLSDKMGFAIIHPYYPAIKKNEAKFYSPEQVAVSTMSSTDLFINRLKRLIALIEKESGGRDIPIAVTEFNGNFVQNDPVRYRFTLFNAIHNAELVRIMLNPIHKVLFANHFHLVNSYWGMIRQQKGKKNLGKQANYYVFDLYNRFLYDELIAVTIDTPTFSFAGAGVVPARIGSKQGESWKEYTGRLPSEWSLRLLGEVSQSQSDGIVRATFPNKDVDYYHAKKTFEVKPDTLYQVSVKVRTRDIAGGKVGIAIEDVRGWKKTFNQPRNIQLSGTSDWQWVTAEIRTLPDAEKIRVIARRQKGKGAISGVAEFAEIRVKENNSKLGEAHSIVGLATQTSDKGAISLIALNKNINKTIELDIKVPLGYKEETGMLLTGSTPFSNNYGGQQGEKSVNYKTAEFKKVEGEQSIKLDIPPASMLGLRFVKSTFRNEVNETVK